MPYASTQNFGAKEDYDFSYLTAYEPDTDVSTAAVSDGRMLRNMYYDDGFGLDQFEVYKLYELPKGLQKVVNEELEEDYQGFMPYLKDVLAGPNPKERIIKDLSDEIYDELYVLPEMTEEEVLQLEAIDEAQALANLEDLEGWGKKFKKAFKKVRKTFKKVRSKITGVIKKTPIIGKIYKWRKKIHRKFKEKVWKPYGGIIIGVAGAVLAPFTGGASLAAAAVITTGKKMYAAKKQAAILKKQAKKEAGAAAAQAKAMESETQKELDKFYNKEKAYFLKYGMTPDKWAKLTVDQKIEFVKAATEGRLPSDVNAAQNAAAADTAAANTAGPTPPTPDCRLVTDLKHDQMVTWFKAGWTVIKKGGAEWMCPPAPTTPPPPPPPPVKPPPLPPTYGRPTYTPSYQPTYYPPPPPPPPTTGTIPPAHAAPTGAYTIYIEGKRIATAPSAEAASALISNMTKPGDRFDVAFNGKSTGLKVRTSTGAVNVPPDQAHAVMRASTSEMQAILGKAEKKGIGIPGWLLIPAAAGAAFVATKV